MAGSEGSAGTEQRVFEREKHIAYFLHSLDCLPSAYESQDVNRLTLAYFCVAGLDILGALDRVDTGSVVDWIYSLQVLPSSPGPGGDRTNAGGFRGSHWIGVDYNEDGVPLFNAHDGPNIAMMYSALAALASLKALDQGRLHKQPMLNTVALLQRPNGSFGAALEGGEDDVRFVFCAAAICFILGDTGTVDVPRSVEFLGKCRAYDGGYGLQPGLEAHGGATYCAVAALRLFHLLSPGACAPERSAPGEPSQCESTSGRQRGKIEGPTEVRGGGEEGETMAAATSAAWLGVDSQRLIHWAVQRQGDSGGFQGRRNKDPDTCYAFWIGAVLHLLGQSVLPQAQSLVSFLLTCQHPRVGGFSKYPGGAPDILHSFYGVCGMSLAGVPGLKRMCPELGVSQESADHVLHVNERSSC